MSATDTLLEEVFKKFGTIKLEASPVTIGVRQAVVEEKRSTNSRGNRGFQSGRGSGFRNEGSRGRGNYGGGRGFNSGGEFNGRNEFANRGGSRGGSSNCNGYQRFENNGGQMNRNGGLANGSVKNTMPFVTYY